jgi:hypothetical protein
VSRFRIPQRQRAVELGLEFLYQTACKPEVFSEYGSDLVSCFQLIAATARNPKLRGMAQRFGAERARLWRAEHRVVPKDADAGTMLELIMGGDAADKLGHAELGIKKHIQEAVPCFPVSEYLRFDPRTEPPPANIPDECKCEEINQRGRKSCVKCKRRLTPLNRYKVWYDALTIVHASECYGVSLGVDCKDLLIWLPSLRPYPEQDSEDFFDSAYAITHLVYALNDYNTFKLSPRLLPQEFAFLRANVEGAIEAQDGEMLGELLDTLMAFGLTERDPIIRAGMEYLLSNQNSDGSWGEANSGEVYDRYHSTWTAIDGLRQYAWQKPSNRFQRLRSIIM